jgi:hippurate hydrolase
MKTLESIRNWHDELTAIRRDLHAHPELGFEEHRTSDIVARKLAEWGLEVHHGIGGTGVVGVLRRGNGQMAIGLRADMDALPMREDNDFAHRSQNPGRMHACGHDGHTTMLLGAARYLSQSGEFNGTVNFIFQPAEEGRGGAEAMIKDGLFQRFPCNFVYGMHNRPGLKVGQFAIRPGTMMAGGAFFDITVTGRGSHGARPEGSIDPVLTACHIATALQSIVSRNVPPADTAVLSVTRVEGGDAYNVIPQQAVLRGTARTMKRETMELLEHNMTRIARGVAEGFGATAETDFRFLFAPLVNNEAETQVIAEAASAVVGEANVETNGPQVMASEDFSFMLESVPGAYINIGNGDVEGSCQVHNPNYEFNDAAIPYGSAMFAALAEKKLPKGAL